MRRRDKKRSEERGATTTPDYSMVLMLVGAVCKFLELVIVREGTPRYMLATLGGLLILIGSAAVTVTSLQVIYAHVAARRSAT